MGVHGEEYGVGWWLFTVKTVARSAQLLTVETLYVESLGEYGCINAVI